MDNELPRLLRDMMDGYVPVEHASHILVPNAAIPNMLIGGQRNANIGFYRRKAKDVLRYMLEDPKVQEACIDPQAVINALQAIELEYDMRFL